MAIIKKKDASVLRQEGKKLYRGRFNYIEVPGGTLKFPLHLHKGDERKTWTLVDDTEYSLPKEVIHHLNNNSGRYTVFEYVTDGDGKPKMKVGRRVARYSFEITDFFDPEGASAPEIYVAENAS